VQQIFPAGFTAQVGYQGIQANHLSKSYINLINPLTGTQPLAGLGFPNQLGSVVSWSDSSFQGLLTSIQRTTRSVFINFNYAWSHSLNEGTQGGGGPNRRRSSVASGVTGGTMRPTSGIVCTGA
jgi:hypothetical protein